MKFFKVCSLFLLLVLSTGLVSIKNDNIPLSQEELKYIFPDDNFRRVVCDNFPNEEITLSKINNLDGEFYASNEDIKDLKGISNLKNIDSFVFWNNNIQSIPTEIETLHKIKSINLANNYITEKDIIQQLINKGVDINYDLNFIKDEKYQYKLNCKYTTLNLNKNESKNLKSLLSKNIETYPKYWEVSNKFSDKCNLILESSDPSSLSVNNNGSCTAGNKSGDYYVVATLNKNKYNGSTVIIKTTIK